MIVILEIIVLSKPVNAIKVLALNVAKSVTISTTQFVDAMVKLIVINVRPSALALM